MKEFILNIQDSMDNPKPVLYTFLVCEKKTIYEARIARNYVASLIKNAKREYLTDDIENNNNPNKFWSKINSIVRAK